MTAERIAAAIDALRGAGHLVEPVSGLADVYRMGEGGAATGAELLALAVRLGLVAAAAVPPRAPRPGADGP